MKNSEYKCFSHARQFSKVNSPVFFNGSYNRELVGYKGTVEDVQTISRLTGRKWLWTYQIPQWEISYCKRYITVKIFIAIINTSIQKFFDKVLLMCLYCLSCIQNQKKWPCSPLAREVQDWRFSAGYFCFKVFLRSTFWGLHDSPNPCYKPGYDSLLVQKIFQKVHSATWKFYLGHIWQWLVIWKLLLLVCILESGITLVHPYSRNKSDTEDCLFFILVYNSWYLGK